MDYIYNIPIYYEYIYVYSHTVFTLIFSIAKITAGYFKSFGVISLFALSIATKVFNDYWLSEWIRSGFTVCVLNEIKGLLSETAVIVEYRVKFFT